MSRFRWLHPLTVRTSGKTSRSKAAPRQRDTARPRLEELESRVVPAITMQEFTSPAPNSFLSPSFPGWVNNALNALENNLTKGVGLKLDGLTYQLGRTLSFDPEKERFIGDSKADQLLTREYRSPFAVAEKV